MEQASRASGSSDYPSPKQPKHVVIHAAELKGAAAKGQQRAGGLIDKFRQRTSQNGSPCDSPAGSHFGSQVGSQYGSQYGSEKSPLSVRARRRDEFDVNSDDEDLDGFIYDDDSTSEDEREDYVNAFSRKKKPVLGEDYSDYEGAAVRALTAGQRKGAVRRTRSSTTDDGDDEWDPEEEQIRQLRQRKKQEERAKAAGLAAKAAPGAGAQDKRAAGPGPSNLGASSSTGTAPAAATSTSGWECASPQRPQPLQAPQGLKMSPQPPPEPPNRMSSGSLRRNAAGSGSGSGGGAAGSGPGPGPGSGTLVRLAGPGETSAAAAAPGAVLRPTPAPPPQVNYGATASSQYWQAKRSQTDAAGVHAEADGQGMSRLEQLAALQKKRAEQAAAAGAAGHEPGQGSDGGNRRGLHWQDESVEAEAAGMASPHRLRIADAPAAQSLPERSPQRQQQQQQHQHQQQQPQQQFEQEQQRVRLVDAPDDAPAKVVVQKKSGGSRKWVAHGARAERDDEGAAAAATSTGQQQHQQDDSGPWPRKHLEGQSFIKHLEPPTQRHLHKAKSGGQGQDQPLAAGNGNGPGQPPPVPRAPPVARCSDVTDFDVDEVLNSFAPGPPEPQEPPQQWAGTRPQPQPATPPGKDAVGNGYAPQHRRSIRAVQSDFTSMRVNDVSDGVTDLTGRVLSLPLQASRPSGAGGPPSPSPPTGVSSAPTVAVSRFARMGASMLGPQGAQDGSGMASAPVCMAAAASGAGGSGYRVSGMGAPGAATLAPSASGVGSGGGQAAAAAPPARRPRRSNPSNDGAVSPKITCIPTALSAPPGDGLHFGGAGAGAAAQCPSNRLSVAGAPPRLSVPGAAGPDSPLVLPALRPSSGGAGGGSILSGPPAVAAVGRSRFGAAQHQQFQQEVARTSLPVMPSQRDYDSDSAITKNVAPARYSYSGAAGGGAGGGGSAFSQGGGYDAGAGAFGAAAARSRLGQVGA